VNDQRKRRAASRRTGAGDPANSKPQAGAQERQGIASKGETAVCDRGGAGRERGGAGREHGGAGREPQVAETAGDARDDSVTAALERLRAAAAEHDGP
jgi:hypothetical protein